MDELKRNIPWLFAVCLVDCRTSLEVRNGVNVVKVTAVPQNSYTERRGRVVNTPAFYSESPGFKSRPGDRLL
jgi:hypothetical protein